MTSPSIHPSAVIENGAVIGAGVQIGAFAYVGPNARIGDNCILHHRSSVFGRATLGEAVEVFPCATIGGAPQFIGLKDDGTSAIEVGARTIVRENVALHTGAPGHGSVTRIGADCFLMANVHIGHDVQMGDKCIIASGTQIGGHTEIGVQVGIGGLVAVHQFSCIGDHAFIGGGSILVSDVIPYGTTVGNHAHLNGLNIKGLSRRGFDKADLRRLRGAYQHIFYGPGLFAERVASAAASCAGDEKIMPMISFIQRDRKRALCKPE